MCLSRHSYLTYRFQLTLYLSIFVIPTADIDDMKISYVLLDGSNATSDIFYFTVEDKGRNPFIFHTCVHWHQSGADYWGIICPTAVLGLYMSFNGFLKLKLPALCQSPECLHHKDLRQLAMTDTQYRAAISFRPTGKGSRFKGQGSKGTSTKHWLWVGKSERGGTTSCPKLYC